MAGLFYISNFVRERQKLLVSLLPHFVITDEDMRKEKDILSLKLMKLLVKLFKMKNNSTIYVILMLKKNAIMKKTDTNKICMEMKV